MYAIGIVIGEDILELYSCCNVRNSPVVDRVGVYANMLKECESLVEQPVCAMSDVEYDWKESSEESVLGSAITSSRGRPFCDHLSTCSNCVGTGFPRLFDISTYHVELLSCSRQ